MALRHNQYKVGDRIQVSGNHPDNHDCEGHKGTIVSVNNSSNYCVKWDNGDYSSSWHDEYDSHQIYDLNHAKYSIGDVLLCDGKYENTVLAIRPDGSDWEYHTSWVNKHNKADAGVGWYHLETAWKSQIIKKAPNSKNKLMNIVTTFKNLFVSEPEKTFRKAQILDEQGDFTQGGREVFLSYLLKKHGDDFKTTVVDQLVAAQEEAKR